MGISKFSDVDEYGFKRSEDFDYKSYEKIMSDYFTVLTNRRMQWEKYLKNKPNLQNNNSTKLKRYIRKGIPGHLRGEIWMNISGGFELQKNQPTLYRELINETEFETDLVDAIKIDLPRTFPDNIFFDNIKFQLFNVLSAYAHHNKEIGYCQGLNYIAGLILIITKNEEWTFWLLKILVENIVPYYHTRTMSGLIVDIGVLKELMKLRVPEINQRLDSVGLPIAVITTKWFICLFAEVLPIETVLRVWDCLFHEGNKILFRVCLTLLLRHSSEILETADISVLATIFQDMVKDKSVINCHEFMQNIFKIPGTLKKKDLEKIRKTLILNGKDKL